MVEGTNPYTVLGVAPDATLPQIKQRYRERVKECHPDLGEGPGRVEAFKRLTWAYQLLLDPVERANHDVAAGRTSAQHHPGQGGLPAGATGMTGTPVPGYQGKAEVAAARERAQHVEELLATGRTKLASGDWRGAEEAGRFALRWDKKNADAYVLIAEAMVANNRLIEARGSLCLALQLAPNHRGVREALWDLQNRQHASGDEICEEKSMPTQRLEPRTWARAIRWGRLTDHLTRPREVADSLDKRR